MVLISTVLVNYKVVIFLIKANILSCNALRKEIGFVSFVFICYHYWSREIYYSSNSLVFLIRGIRTILLTGCNKKTDIQYDELTHPNTYWNYTVHK